MQKALSTNFTSFVEQPKKLLPGNKGNGQDQMLDLFANGDFANYQAILATSQIEGIKLPQTDVNDLFYNVMVASIINQLWKQQNTWIGCYRMSQNTFDTYSFKKGYGINKNLTWYDKDSSSGCYVQNSRPNALSKSIGYNLESPGRDKLYGGTFAFTATDMIIGSVASNSAGGDSYTTDLTSKQSLLGTSNQHKIFTNPGLFNIPVCNNNFGDLTLDAFMSTVAAPNTAANMFCKCMNAKDVDGRTIMDAIPQLKKLTCTCDRKCCQPTKNGEHCNGLFVPSSSNSTAGDLLWANATRLNTINA
ncbi:hypothetical protein BT63DRAFT_215130 [Microthyrium microscopicum]|uniref:Uncharacterized protein n=1 Tax=Microthyrium microscopicum TaxID=703497 RepID=A0A6A6UGP2_9PEZI|nr:hypothetical protein BT63DRAFT_215130 [Microthyrium microscopicum]